MEEKKEKTIKENEPNLIFIINFDEGTKEILDLNSPNIDKEKKAATSKNSVKYLVLDKDYKLISRKEHGKWYKEDGKQKIRSLVINKKMTIVDAIPLATKTKSN